MTPDEQYLSREFAQRSCTTHYRDRIFQSMLLRSARTAEDKAILQRIILDAREAWKVREVVNQRKWQTNISRRPQRTRHHDSWGIRESYVRGGSYLDYLPTPGSPLSPYQKRQQELAA